jgi:hypothetical protein
MINNRVMAIAGLGLDDLPDTAILCDMIDDLEACIEDEDMSKEELAEIASEYARDFLADEGYPTEELV